MSKKVLKLEADLQTHKSKIKDLMGQLARRPDDDVYKQLNEAAWQNRRLKKKLQGEQALSTVLEERCSRLKQEKLELKEKVEKLSLNNFHLRKKRFPVPHNKIVLPNQDTLALPLEPGNVRGDSKYICLPPITK